ncbi:MAG: TetR family transcriptional regulator [Acidobacteria bacterium]|nr:TetR family transcriptional regulator [Acidobacteriaceae bacterium]MBV9610774.1 TetR family transcriptional regulator [Acidobacteriota bacterium]
MPTATKTKAKAGSRGKPEESREAILEAALKEFAQEGLAGARTDAIAQAAGLNKALLYYYFGDKEKLYGAVLDRVFSGLSDAVLAAMESERDSAGKILAWAGAHFDYLANSPVAPRVVQRELMRAGRSGSPHMRRLAERYMRPVFLKLMETLRAGMAAGQFRKIDPVDFILSTIAMIVFYFGSTTMVEIVTHMDPLAPERIAQRRFAVLDMVAASLLVKTPDDAPASKVTGSNPFGVESPSGPERRRK